MEAFPSFETKEVRALPSGALESPTIRSIYLNGEYLARNPMWHAEELAWKAVQIVRMLQKHRISPRTACDVGCGVGEVLKELQNSLDKESQLYGYDISPQAIGIAKTRANEGLLFCNADFLSSGGACFHLMLSLDVIEHLEAYFGLLRGMKTRAHYKIFHIPLDISVQTVLRKNGLLKRRNLHYHLHFFSRETALQTLRDACYEVLDYFYTPRANEVGEFLGSGF